jgi:hypothetical protein
LRYDGTTGAFLSTFVTPDSGGLQFPTFMTFTETDPTTLNYDGGGAAELNPAAVSSSIAGSLSLTDAMTVPVSGMDTRSVAWSEPAFLQGIASTPGNQGASSGLDLVPALVFKRGDVVDHQHRAGGMRNDAPATDALLTPTEIDWFFAGVQ